MIPSEVSIDIGVVGTSEVMVMGGVLLTAGEDEMSPVEADDGDTSDHVEAFGLTLEGEEWLGVPEVAVSWEVGSVGVFPLRDDEGLDVTIGEIVRV